jgi:glycerol-3-phosphate dehydrogenase
MKMSNICLGRLFYAINFSLSTNCHFQKIPENVVAITDLVEACTDSDILVFVVPHQLVSKLCGQLKGKVKQNAIAVSLIKVTIGAENI